MSTGFIDPVSTKDATPVTLVSNLQDDGLQTGRTKPTLVTGERPQSVNIVVDGKTRTQYMDPFNFRVTMNSNLYRSRMARVVKVVLPHTPNITKFNNVINFRQWDGFVITDHTITLPVGFYDEILFTNRMSLLMTAAAGVGTYLATYSMDEKSFTVEYRDGGGVLSEFYFVDTSSFIIRGEFFASFESFPPGLDPVVVGRTSYTSCVAGMLYSRYAIVSSESFNQYTYADSRATSSLLKSDIICVVDVASDLGPAFRNLFAAVRTPDSPHLMVANPQRNLNDRIDILVQDEYGENYNELFDFGPDRAPNCVGISLWLEVTF